MWSVNFHLCSFVYLSPKDKSTQQKKEVAAASPSVPFFFLYFKCILINFSLAIRAIPKPLSQSKYQSFWFLLVPQQKKMATLPSLILHSNPNTCDAFWVLKEKKKKKKKKKIEEETLINLVVVALVVAGPWPAPVAQRVVLLRWVGSHQRGWWGLLPGMWTWEMKGVLWTVRLFLLHLLCLCLFSEQPLRLTRRIPELPIFVSIFSLGCFDVFYFYLVKLVYWSFNLFYRFNLVFNFFRFNLVF